jgi:hypothetical protein
MPCAERGSQGRDPEKKKIIAETSFSIQHIKGFNVDFAAAAK